MARLLVVLLPAGTALFVHPRYAMGLVTAREVVFLLGAALLGAVLASRPGRSGGGGAPVVPWLLVLAFLGVQAWRAPLPGMGLSVLGLALATWLLREGCAEVGAEDRSVLAASARVLAGAAVVVALVAVLQLAGLSPIRMPSYVAAGEGLVAERRAVFSLLGNPLFVACHLTASLPFVLWAAATTSSTMGTVAGGAGVATMVAGLLATFCRGALAVAVLSAAVAVGGLHRCGGLRRRFVVAAAAGVAVGVGVFLALNPYGQGLAARMVSSADPSEVGRARRATEWAVALELFRGSPLAGVGSRGYEAAFVPTVARLWDGDELGRRHHSTRWAHDDYLQFLAEHGLAGVSVLGFLVVAEARRLRPLPGGGLDGLAVACLGCLGSVALLAVPYFPLSRPELLVLVALSLAGLPGGGGSPARPLPGLRPLRVALALLLLLWAARSWTVGRALADARRGSLSPDAIFSLLSPSSGPSPFQPEVARMLAGAAWAQGDVAAASRWNGQAMAAGPLEADVALEGEIVARQGGERSAVDFLGRWSRVFPRSAELPTNLGVHLARAGDVPGAVAAFREALRRRPDHVPAHVDLIQLLARRAARGLVAPAEVEAAVTAAEAAVSGHGGLFRTLAARAGVSVPE